MYVCVCVVVAYLVIYDSSIKHNVRDVLYRKMKKTNKRDTETRQPPSRT